MNKNLFKEILEIAGFNSSDQAEITNDLSKVASVKVFGKLLSGLSAEDKNLISKDIKNTSMASNTEIIDIFKNHYPLEEIKTEVMSVSENLVTDYIKNILEKTDGVKRERIVSLINDREKLEQIRKSLAVDTVS